MMLLEVYYTIRFLKWQIYLVFLKKARRKQEESKKKSKRFPHLIHWLPLSGNTGQWRGTTWQQSKVYASRVVSRGDAYPVTVVKHTPSCPALCRSPLPAQPHAHPRFRQFAPELTLPNLAKRTIEQEVNESNGVYLLLSFTDLSHHRTCRSAYGGSLHSVQLNIVVHQAGITCYAKVQD